MNSASSASIPAHPFRATFSEKRSDRVGSAIIPANARRPQLSTTAPDLVTVGSSAGIDHDQLRRRIDDDPLAEIADHRELAPWAAAAATTGSRNRSQHGRCRARDRGPTRARWWHRRRPLSREPRPSVPRAVMGQQATEPCVVAQHGPEKPKCARWNPWASTSQVASDSAPIGYQTFSWR